MKNALWNMLCLTTKEFYFFTGRCKPRGNQELKDITDEYMTNSFWDSLSDYSIWDYGDN